MAQTGTSSISNPIEAIAAFTRNQIDGDIATVFGLLAILVLAIVGLGFVGLQILRLSRALYLKAAYRNMKADKTPGNKILVGTVRGTGGGRARRHVLMALQQHLPDFNFRSAFYMNSAPLRVESTEYALSSQDRKTLSEAFEQSEADLIVWGVASSKPDTVRLCFSTPALLKGEDPSGFFAFDIHQSPKDWHDDMYRAIAYVAGRRLRPSIGTPSAYKADRLEPMLDAMIHLLESRDVLSGQALVQLEDDFSAGALHVGELITSQTWLEKSAECRQRVLEKLSLAENPLRWSQAKIDLGRAMIGLCDQKFDQIKLQEGMTHIREGIDATKFDRRMQLAEIGFQSLKRGEEILATRRRFSIRWSV